MANKKALPQLHHLKHVHIVGVCGMLMGAFASFLKRRGIEVSGSDQNVYPPMSDLLHEAGVKLFSKYDSANLSVYGPEKIDLVVIGNVARSDNPEAREAIDKGYCYSSLPEAMETLMLQQTQNIVIAGTHGKTTTSALVSHILNYAGLDPAYFIGGVVKDLPYTFSVPSIEKGRPFVLEGDEYDTAFWDKVPKFNHYLPDDVILTSVEYDHADIYPSFEALYKVFEGLVSRIRSNGKLIACYDYEQVALLTKKSKVPVITYGSKPGRGIQYTPGKQIVGDGVVKFEVRDGDKIVEELELQIPGNHNVINAMAAWVECASMGLDRSKLRSSIAAFRGVKRRQEVRGVINDIIVMDDFGHHPTAVRETLKALKEFYPKRRILAVFEPRSATSRRKIFQKHYVEAFDSCHTAFISAPYEVGKLPVQDQFSSGQLVEDLSTRGKSAVLMTTIDGGVADIAAIARPGDLVVVLSNGGFGGLIPKLMEILERKDSGQNG